MQNTRINKIFFPIILIEVLTTNAMTAQIIPAIEFTLKVIGSIVSMQIACNVFCKQKKKLNTIKSTSLAIRY
jgi:hypothetical protein